MKERNGARKADSNKTVNNMQTDDSQLITVNDFQIGDGIPTIGEIIQTVPDIHTLDNIQTIDSIQTPDNILTRVGSAKMVNSKRSRRCGVC